MLIFNRCHSLTHPAGQFLCNRAIIAMRTRRNVEGEWMKSILKKVDYICILFATHLLFSHFAIETICLLRKYFPRIPEPWECDDDDDLCVRHTHIRCSCGTMGECARGMTWDLSCSLRCVCEWNFLFSCIYLPSEWKMFHIFFVWFAQRALEYMNETLFQNEQLSRRKAKFVIFIVGARDMSSECLWHQKNFS